MNTLKVKQLLMKTAASYYKSKVSVSKSEISKRISEIKYLSAQKKVPRLSLRKEIVVLEQQLKSIIDLEKALLTEKRKESGKVLALKNEIKRLQARIAAAEDNDMRKKVEKLSHLLGENLAKQEVPMNVSLAKKAAEELKTQKKEEQSLEERYQRIRNVISSIQLKIHTIQEELEMKAVQSADPEKIQKISQRVDAIERMIENYIHSHPEIFGVRDETTIHQEVKHTMIFTPPKVTAVTPQLELPLPPPPRMVR